MPDRPGSASGSGLLAVLPRENHLNSVAQSPLYGVRTSPPVRVEGLPDPGRASPDSGMLYPSLTQFSYLSIKFAKS